MKAGYVEDCQPKGESNDENTTRGVDVVVPVRVAKRENNWCGELLWWTRWEQLLDEARITEKALGYYYSWSCCGSQI